MLRALSQSFNDVVKRLDVNFVYQSPTITSLAQTIYILSGSDADAQMSKVDRVTELWRIAKSFTSSFPSRSNTSNGASTDKDVVLVTGTTGGLGSDILSRLLQDESIGRVYAFNRPSSNVQIAERQLRAFRERGLNVDELSSDKLKVLEGDMKLVNLGLDEELYKEVRHNQYVS